MKIVNLRYEKYDIYIGRENKTYNLLESKWHNPFKLSECSLEESIKLYENHVRETDLYNQLDELEGLMLACWCKPKICHGDILIKLFHEKRLNSMLENC
jgi:hypothetical protein